MRSRILYLTAIFATVVFPSQGWGQKGGIVSQPRPAEVRGQLRLAGGRTAPIGIPVVLIYRTGSLVSQTQTDSSGKFTFEGLQPQMYRVKIHAMGFLDIESEDLDLSLNRMSYVVLELKADPNYRNPFVTAAPGGVISAEQLNAPDEAKRALASGEELLQKGTDFPKSIDFFQKAVKAYPRYSEAYLMMGVAYRAQNNYDEAEAALRKCIEINANSAPAYTALGEIQNEKRRYAEAEKTLLKAVALSPESPQAHEELARTYLAQKRWREAEPHALKAITLAPNSPNAHVFMGNIDLKKRDGQGALQQFREYLKLEPDGALAPNVRDLVSQLERALAQSRTPVPTKNQ